jgi:hypothetical protein
MRLYIIRLFILCGLFFSALASAITPISQLANSRVFTYAEANYPDIFTGKAAEEGHYQQYLYRYYPASGNYLGIDPIGDIFVLGPYTDNELMAVGNMADYDSTITAWEEAQFLASERVFSYAEANFPAIFTGKVEGASLSPQFPYYRHYPISDNSLGIDRAGDIFIWGPYTGGVQTAVGNVDDHRSAILAWVRILINLNTDSGQFEQSKP